jgi:hypothetical protein
MPPTRKYAQICDRRELRGLLGKRAPVVMKIKFLTCQPKLAFGYDRSDIFSALLKPVRVEGKTLDHLWVDSNRLALPKDAVEKLGGRLSFSLIKIRDVEEAGGETLSAAD